MLLFHNSFKKNNFVLNLNLREIIKFLLNLIWGDILYLLRQPVATTLNIIIMPSPMPRPAPGLLGKFFEDIKIDI